MSKPMIVSLVPGDDWAELISVTNPDGSPVDYSGWTITVSEITWSKGTIQIVVDTAQASTGKFGLSAGHLANALLPYGPGAHLLIRGQSPIGTVETIFYATVDGVRIKAVNALTVVHPGTQGPAGIIWRGDWEAGKSYEITDGVYLDGSSYRAIASHQASADNEPGTGAHWRDFWAVVALGANEAEVGLVAANIDKVTTVADHVAEVGAVAEAIAPVEIVAGMKPEVLAVAQIAGQVQTTASLSVQIQMLAEINYATAIVTVSANIASVANVSANMAAVLASPGYAAAAAASAGDALTYANQAQGWRNDTLGYQQQVTSLKASVDQTYAAMQALWAANSDYSNTLAQLTGAAKQIVAAADVVAAIIYDTTTKDSDGGAWRQRTRGTSWYNEALNTATRGATRGFPQRALIVVRDTSLTIYDVGKASCPMWMVFNAGAQNLLGSITLNTGGAAVCAINGMIIFGASTYDVHGIDFITDTSWRSGNASTIVGSYLGSIADRNASKTFDITAAVWPANSGRWAQIASRAVKALDAYVAPGTPIDPVRKLPNPTIAIATDTGVSVVHWNGRVTNSAVTQFISKVAFEPSGALVAGNSNGPNYYADPSVYAGASFGMASITFPWNYINGAIYQAMLHDAAGDNAGLGLIKRVKTSLGTLSLIAKITSQYNTGWYPIGVTTRLALAESVADLTSLIGATPLNDTFSYADKEAAQAAGWGSSGVESPADVQWDIVGGALQIMRGAGGVAGSPIVTITGLKIGSRYAITADIGTTRAYMYVGGVAVPGQPFAAGTAKTLSFVATATSMQLQIYTDVSSTTVIDNLRVDLVASDRSVALNHPRAVGTVTRAAVATGADLAAYGGFSAANYLEVPAGAIDLGSGDWSFMAWCQRPGSDATNLRLFGLGYYSGGAYVGAQILATLQGSASSYNLSMTLKDSAGATAQAFSSSAAPTDAWFLATYVRRGNTFEIWINDKLAGTVAATSVALGSYTNANATLRIGCWQDGTSGAAAMKVSQFRVIKGAPTPSQIRAIYADELPMLQPAAKCLLNGSDNVQGLSYDAGTDLRYVAKAAGGTDYFKGLVRLGTINMASENALGPEIIVNGDFAANVNSWTQIGSGTFAWNAGKARTTTVGGIGGRGIQNITGLVVGRTYLLSAEVATASNNGRVTVSNTGSVASFIVQSSGGSRTASSLFVATATSTTLIIDNSSAVDGTFVDFDNVSLREVTTLRLASDNHKGVAASDDNIIIGTDADVYARTAVVDLREALLRRDSRPAYNRNVVELPGCAVTSNATPAVIACIPMDKGEAGDWVIETVAREYGDPASQEFGLIRDHLYAYRPGEGTIALSGASTQTIIRRVTATLAVAVQVNTATNCIEVLATPLAGKNLEWGVKAVFFPVSQQVAA